MRHSRLLTPLLATFALVACSEAQVANDAGNAAVIASDASPAPTAATKADAPSANAAWGAVQPDDEASHRGLDFIVFNRSGRTITAIAIRPDEGPLDPGVGEAPWSENILVQRELPDGQRAASHYEADLELCTWKIRATFSDGRTREYPTVNLCETIRVDLR